MEYEVRVYDSVVVVVGPKHGFEADNAAAAHTGLPVESFRRAVRMNSFDSERGANVWKYSIA